MNGRTVAHSVAARKVTIRIFQEANVSLESLFDDLKDYRAETENSLKEIKERFDSVQRRIELRARNVAE